METKKSIIIEFVKSNKSDAMVWKVSIPGKKKETSFCKKAISAIKYAFFLKAQTGLPVNDYCLRTVRMAVPKTETPPKAE